MLSHLLKPLRHDLALCYNSLGFVERDLDSSELDRLHNSLGSVAGGLYNIPLHLRLRGPLDPDAFARAWQAVAERQPVLRTAYAWDDHNRLIAAVEQQRAAHRAST